MYTQFVWLYNRIVYISCGGKFSRTVTSKSLDNKPVSTTNEGPRVKMYVWPKHQQNTQVKMVLKL